MRILLLEDDEILSDMLVKSLTHQHYIVDAVHDGESGWEYARNGNYELLIMDVGLPLLDGITLCQRLRKQGCSTPILLMTAKNAITDRINGLDAGADDYLSKPFGMQEFLARVEALVRRKRTPVAPAYLDYGALQIDLIQRRVRFKGEFIDLTPTNITTLHLHLGKK